MTDYSIRFIKLYIFKISRPKITLETINSKFVNPVDENESLINIVHIIKPVFLIIWLYLSVYRKDNRSIKTSAIISIEKKVV